MTESERIVFCRKLRIGNVGVREKCSLSLLGEEENGNVCVSKARLKLEAKYLSMNSENLLL